MTATSQQKSCRIVRQPKNAKKEARDGAACQWHAFSTDRSGAETAACQWHAFYPQGTFGADRSGAKTEPASGAACLWHALSADRNGVKTPIPVPKKSG